MKITKPNNQTDERAKCEPKWNEDGNKPKDLENIAWCDCGDALEAIPIRNEKELIVGYEYFCFGCQKTYVLAEKRLSE